MIALDSPGPVPSLLSYHDPLPRRPLHMRIRRSPSLERDCSRKGYVHCSGILQLANAVVAGIQCESYSSGDYDPGKNPHNEAAQA
jgi:hypothetical protein